MLIRIFLVCCTFFAFSETIQLSLAEAESIALKQNRLLLELSQTVEAAKAYKIERLSKWLPDLKIKYYMYRDTVENIQSQSKSNFLTHIQLSQEIFDSNTYYGLVLAEYGIQLVNDLYKSAENDVLFAVRSQYYKIVTDYHMIEAAEEHVLLLKQLAQQMEDRYQIGTSIEYNVNQSLVAVSNAMQVYYKQIRVLKDDLDALANFLGFLPGEVDLIVTENTIPLQNIPSIASRVETTRTLFSGNTQHGPIFTPSFPGKERGIMARLYSHPEIASLTKLAMAHNPIIHKMETELSIAQKKVKEAYGAYLPSLSAKFNVGGIPDPFDFYPSSRFDNMRFDAGVGLNFSWTIFDSFGRESRVSQAKHKRNAAEWKLDKERQNLLQEVRSEIHGLEEAIASFVTAKSNNTLAIQTLEQAKEQLEVGYIDIFDFQISVNGLIQAMTAEIEAEFDVIRSYYGLLHATGGYEEDGTESKQ